ncbi:chaperone protein dnaJ 49 [Phoenix dactylifera]|uniref:Chaperone protein dnaJ 49 n=1 Tax=Phoenix dactylifera TaxID=42345 RepID=A0A8B7C1X4_PHODC|nr:chaperone protein dnaJ 49 [Phoenix dactylifera]
MDGNKDEAVRCVKLAESALASGDKQRAFKFIRIARRLDHNLVLDDLLAACEKLDSSNSTAREEEIAVDQAHNDRNSSNASEASNGDRNYTEEHVTVIREIKRNKDYYAILGVEKSCSVEEIRKAYRKLSLKVHPDKNKAPGAEEAFKAVCKAFKCLSDEESRRHYDQTGIVEGSDFNQQYSNMRRRRRRASRNDFFDENFDPDEIFRSFFGSQGDVFRAQRVYRTREMGPRGRQQRDVQGGGNNFIFLLQLSPILLFFLLAFFPFPDPQFSLQKNYTYQIPKVTKKHGVEYFVKSEDFDQRFPEGSPAREDLEHNVLRDYKSVLGRLCHVELQRRTWVRTYPTPHCDKLRSLGVS